MPATLDRISTEDALFPILSSEDIDCLRGYGQKLELNPGDVLFAQGQPAEAFFIIMSGRIRVAKSLGSEEIELRIHLPGEFTGEITSLIAGQPQIATGKAMDRCEVLRIPLDGFKDVLAACPSIREVVVPAIARRTPEANALAQQREKMASLGVLSAGLAHEINNPAAAVKRGASQLKDAIERQMHLTLKLAEAGVMKKDCSKLREFRASALQRAAVAEPLNAIERADREDALSDWLDAHNVAESWDIAPTLVDAQVTPEHLDQMAAFVEPSNLSDTIRWAETSIFVGRVIDEIENSADRISGLVGAIKEYSYMDQASLQDVVIQDGIESTLKILSYKVRHGAVEIVRDFAPDMPTVPAYGGDELNQVWTNLLDNALDAIDGKGKITIRTRVEHGRAVVEIGDDGPGIPAAIKSKIFDPFFTTKPVGKGTGLGLDTSYRIVVGRHHGTISVDSKPGATTFRVELPLAHEQA